VPDKDLFPQQTGKGWKKASEAIGELDPAAPDAEERWRRAGEELARALAATLEEIPPGSLDLPGVATELQRLARAGDVDVDLCAAFGDADDDEAGRLLALVARMLLATMGGELAGLATGEIGVLLARHFLRALARRAGFDRRLPFGLGSQLSAADALARMEEVLAGPAVEELIPVLLDRCLQPAGGKRDGC